MGGVVDGERHRQVLVFAHACHYWLALDEHLELLVAVVGFIELVDLIFRLRLSHRAYLLREVDRVVDISDELGLGCRAKNLVVRVELHLVLRDHAVFSSERLV